MVQPLQVLVGCRTSAERRARGQGLALFQATEGGGAWTPQHLLNMTNPSYQVVNRAGSHAYSVHGDLGEVSVIGLPTGGRLRWLQHRATGGRNPVHLCLSGDERHLLVANYATGSLACFDVLHDGLLGEPTALLGFSGTAGPRVRDQKGSHPHQVVHWPGTPFYLVPDKGLDRVHVVRLDAEGDLLAVAHHQASPGAGPRHLVVDEKRCCVWLVHELGSAVTHLGFDPLAGQLSPGAQVSVLPEGFTGESSAAGIALHPAGHTLYVSNRGHDSVCVLDIDSDGTARPQHWLPVLGRTPRFIGLSPAADALIVANEDSDTLVRFPLDTHGLPGVGVVIATTGNPVCITFLPNPAPLPTP